MMTLLIVSCEAKCLILWTRGNPASEDNRGMNWTKV
jgi:hypothetical protein